MSQPSFLAHPAEPNSPDPIPELPPVNSPEYHDAYQAAVQQQINRLMTQQGVVAPEPTSAMSNAARIWLAGVLDRKAQNPELNQKYLARQRDALTDETLPFAAQSALASANEELLAGVEAADLSASAAAVQFLTVRAAAEKELHAIGFDAKKLVDEELVRRENEGFRALPVWQPVADLVIDPQRTKYVCLDEIYDGIVSLEIAEWPRVDADGRVVFATPQLGDATSLTVYENLLQAFMGEHRRFLPATIEKLSPLGVADLQRKPVHTGNVFAMEIADEATAGALETDSYDSYGEAGIAVALSTNVTDITDVANGILYEFYGGGD